VRKIKRRASALADKGARASGRNLRPRDGPRESKSLQRKSAPPTI